MLNMTGLGLYTLGIHSMEVLLCPSLYCIRVLMAGAAKCDPSERRRLLDFIIISQILKCKTLTPCLNTDYFQTLQILALVGIIYL